eukprot:TRINITY_DN2485_c0_g2_i1.p1 TRINITY_DN2485_c0_g2~~TRINITY_DN2485_c0_g2_i1.p1  ORF type:complete len:466 (-),score=29.09 TRINITY_DN2485_c0_g2_i1:86-1309(-)
MPAVTTQHWAIHPYVMVPVSSMQFGDGYPYDHTGQPACVNTPPELFHEAAGESRWFQMPQVPHGHASPQDVDTYGSDASGCRATNGYPSNAGFEAWCRARNGHPGNVGFEAWCRERSGDINCQDREEGITIFLPSERTDEAAREQSKAWNSRIKQLETKFEARWLIACEYLSPSELDAVAGTSCTLFQTVKRSYQLVHASLPPRQFGQWLSTDFAVGDQVSVPHGNCLLNKEPGVVAEIDNGPEVEQVEVVIHHGPTADCPDQIVLSMSSRWRTKQQQLQQVIRHARKLHVTLPSESFTTGDRVYVWSQSFQHWFLDGEVTAEEVRDGVTYLSLSYGDGMSKEVVSTSPHVRKRCNLLTEFDVICPDVEDPHSCTGRLMLNGPKHRMYQDWIRQLDGLAARDRRPLW